MSGEGPSGKRKQRTRAEITKELGGNFKKSSLNMDNIQNNLFLPACVTDSLADVATSATRTQFLCEVPRQTFELELEGRSSPLENTAAEKSEYVDFQMAFQAEEFEPVGQEDEGSTGHGEFTVTDNTYIIEQGRTSHSVDERLSPTDEKNDEDSDWLCEYLTKIQDTLHEELVHIEQDVDAEDVPNGETFEGPYSYEDFTQKDSVDNDDNLDFKPLYSGAAITVGLSALLIMTFALRHMLSGEALSDMLTLISAHCLSPNLCLKSLFQLKKHFHNLKAPMTFHRYCSHCFLHIDKNVSTCPNSFCAHDPTCSGNTAFFIEIPVASQIREFFARPGFFDFLKKRFFRRKKDEHNIEDIYDGELYRKHSGVDGILSNEKNISLMWNTDGIPVFKSSKFSLWPLYFIINELPYKERINRDNMIFAGLWFGSSKPNMLTFLQPFHSSLSAMESEGLLVETSEGHQFTTRVILLAGTSDLPAKCLVCNSVQYNGFYGCLKCKQAGQTVKTVKGGHVHAFPFNFDDPKGPKRTHAGTLEDSHQASQLKVGNVNGIKGPSWFGGLKYHDIIEGTGIDYMHCVLLGICKRLMSLWFDSGEKTAEYRISSRISQVDARLSSIKPPHNISRVPRSIEHHRKYFKASELRSFLLFYGPAILYGILPKPYYQHFLLLSEAIFILLLDSISETQLQLAERLLFHFCILFEGYYGLRFQTANFHLLLHLVDGVRTLGPLWTHSCFHFEDKNGFLLKTFHGTQNIQFQIISAVSISKKLPELKRTFLPEEGPITDFYKKLISSKRISDGLELTEGYFALGASSERKLTDCQLQVLSDFLGWAPPTSVVKYFTRLKSEGHILHSRSYERVRNRNSFTVCLRGEHMREYGQIEFFFQCKPMCFCISSTKCNCSVRNLAVVTRLRECDDITLIDDCVTNATLSHVTVVSVPQAEDVVVVDIKELGHKCVFMQFQDDLPGVAFLAAFPNAMETD